MDIAKRIALWVGLAIIAIVKLPFTLSSLITTGVEHFLLWLGGIVIGRLGDEDVREVWNFAMDVNIECNNGLINTFEDMKL
jgi:hypothetical protein